MVGWNHRLNGHEFEQTLGVGDEQGGLVCCSPWGCKELNTIEQLNLTEPRMCQQQHLSVAYLFSIHSPIGRNYHEVSKGKKSLQCFRYTTVYPRMII